MGNTAGHTLTGAITGSNDLTFAAGVVTYSGASASTFTGNIFVTGGKLRLANGSTFNNATILSIGSAGTVDLNAAGSSWNFAGLNDISGAGGTLTNAGGTRTINLRGGGNYAFSGNVQGNVKLVVNLSGTGSRPLPEQLQLCRNHNRNRRHTPGEWNADQCRRRHRRHTGTLAATAVSPLPPPSTAPSLPVMVRARSPSAAASP